VSKGKGGKLSMCADQYPGKMVSFTVLICIKLAMNMFFFYMALAPYGFDAGQRHNLGNWKWLALKISTFLGPNSSLFAPAFFRARPFQLPK